MPARAISRSVKSLARINSHPLRYESACLTTAPLARACGGFYHLLGLDFMRWFPVAFLANDVFIGTHLGIELTSSVL